MSISKIYLSIFLLAGFINPCLASPPIPVLRTCIDHQPYNDAVNIAQLDGNGFSDESMDGCEEQYDREVDGRLYGSLSCNDKFYLIINDKKIDPELANNMSVNPEIKPGVEFTTRSIWYKIAFEDKQYACIVAPLAEQGVGAAYTQYYIIENAFDDTQNPELYFYFFDKNIVPITSKNL